MLCRELYHAALPERIESYQTHRKGVTWLEQPSPLPASKEARPEFKNLHAPRPQAVLIGLHRAFQNFFGRIRKGPNPGFPRFKGAHGFHSLVCTSAAYQVHGRRVQISKVGNVKIKMHRPRPKEVGTRFVKNVRGAGYGCFACAVETDPLPAIHQAMGIDVGLKSFAVLSDGTAIENPRYDQQAQSKLRVAQRRVARRKRGHRRGQAVLLLHKIGQHMAQQRADFQHQLSNGLVQNYGTMAVEDLNVPGLAGSMLAKFVPDAAGAGFFQKLAYQAASAGREFIPVPAPGTSPTCICGAAVPKRLSDREQVCTACGLITDRDHLSARVILQRARIVPSCVNVGEVMPCVA
jgi:putative transposase